MLGFYPQQTSQIDAETFLAGVVTVLAYYPASVADYVVDPITGLPGRLKFLPTIAEIKEACEERYGKLIEQRKRDERERQRRLADPFQLPPLKITATTSALCAQYGLREIPKDWDALDVVRAAAKYGAGLQQAIDEGLVNSGLPPRPNAGLYQEVAAKSRAAMNERLERIGRASAIEWP